MTQPYDTGQPGIFTVPPTPSVLQLQAATPAAGFALQNGTPNILTWNVPNDGQVHYVTIFSLLHVTAAETGGQINLTYTGPFGGATPHTSQIFAAGLGTDTAGQFGNGFQVAVGAGTIVTLSQTALTVGTATVWAALFGL